MVLKITDFTSVEKVHRDYLFKKLSYESIEIIGKQFKKMNRALARKIAEDIISRYDIILTQNIIATDLSPTISITYKVKPKLKKISNT